MSTKQSINCYILVIIHKVKYLTSKLRSQNKVCALKANVYIIYTVIVFSTTSCERLRIKNNFPENSLALLISVYTFILRVSCICLALKTPIALHI